MRLEPTTYGVPVRCAFVRILAAFPCLVAGAWSWLFGSRIGPRVLLGVLPHRRLPRRLLVADGAHGVRPANEGRDGSCPQRGGSTAFCHLCLEEASVKLPLQEFLGSAAPEPQQEPQGEPTDSSGVRQGRVTAAIQVARQDKKGNDHDCPREHGNALQAYRPCHRSTLQRARQHRITDGNGGGHARCGEEDDRAVSRRDADVHRGEAKTVHAVGAPLGQLLATHPTRWPSRPLVQTPAAQVTVATDEVASDHGDDRAEVGHKPRSPAKKFEPLPFRQPRISGVAQLLVHQLRIRIGHFVMYRQWTTLLPIDRLHSNQTGEAAGLRSDRTDEEATATGCDAGAGANHTGLTTAVALIVRAGSSGLRAKGCARRDSSPRRRTACCSCPGGA